METATKTPRKVAASIGRASTTRAGLAMAARFPQAGDPDLARVCSLLQRAGSRAFTLGVEGCNGPPWGRSPAAVERWQADFDRRDAANDRRMDELAAALGEMIGQPVKVTQESLCARIVLVGMTSREAWEAGYRCTATGHVRGQERAAFYITGEVL